MSRIHDALKKASKEKTSQVLAVERVDVAPIGVDIPQSILSAGQVAEQVRSIRPSEVGHFLRFDDLIKWCAHPEWKPDADYNLFRRADDSAKNGTERFRTLRSRLYQIAAARPLRRVLVTSSVPGEGKTFVATNLAQSIVRQPDKRVLMIDADLRAPRLHIALGAPIGPGLTDYLRGEADEYAVIQHGPDANLCFIPSGRPVSDPSELLSSDRMKKLLDLVAPVFDWVILDSPPALPIHDANILADLCDGALFVLRAGETRCDIAEKGVLEFRGKNLLGVVLNQVDYSEGYAGYTYDSPGTEGEILQ
jgi:capsular exopolysaccharide synthesis family protein